MGVATGVVDWGVNIGFAGGTFSFFLFPSLTTSGSFVIEGRDI